MQLVCGTDRAWQAPRGAAFALCIAAAGSILAVATSPLRAQEWREVSLGARADFAVCFDAAHGRTILFGGTRSLNPLALELARSATWSYDGSTWQRIETSALATPGGRLRHAMAFDLARGRSVLFGGALTAPSNSVLNDTWEFDGASWTRILTSTTPSARHLHALAYDMTRNRTVLFGGNNGTADLDDTWEFDGANWTRITTATVPAVAAGARPLLAHDVWRAQTVLVLSAAIASTWLYDGIDWRPSPVPQPPFGPGTTMAFDLQHGHCIVAEGGSSRTWVFDGSAWTQAAANPPLLGGQMVFDFLRDRCIVVEEQTAIARKFDGSTWSIDPRPPRQDCATVYDPALPATVIFGSDAVAYGTWEFDGHTMSRVATTGSPAGGGHAAAYHARLGAVVLLDRLGTTWNYRGHDWVPLNPSASPPARSNHAVAYDPRRGRLLLFGGVIGTQAQNDLWSFDGVTWTVVAPPHAAPARYQHGLAFDLQRERFVMFGGIYQSGYWANDTWEFDGADWLATATNGPPATRVNPAMAYDPVRGRVVMVGGDNLADCWSYGAEGWIRLSLPAPSAAGGLHGMTWDGQRLLLQAGELWRLADTAPWSRYGPGCRQPPALQVGLACTNAPLLGQTFQVFAFPLPAQPGTIELAFGLGLGSWGAQPLPIALPSLGPNCLLWVPPDLRLTLAHAGGALSLPIAVPNLPSLAGLVFGVQGLVTDASGAFVGLTNSLAIRLQ